MATGKPVMETSSGQQVRAKEGDTLNLPSGTQVNGTALNTHISNQVGNAARTAWDLSVTAPSGNVAAGDFIFCGATVAKASKGTAGAPITGYCRTAETAGDAVAVAPMIGLACDESGTAITYSELASATGGDPVWLGAAGRPTLTIPSTGGDYVRQLGYVEFADGSGGRLYIQMDSDATLV